MNVLNNRFWTQPDSRLVFIYHGLGIVTGVRWPTGPEQGGTAVRFYGINFQYASVVKCKFGEYQILGNYSVRFMEDPVTGEKELEAQLLCPVPALKDLQLPSNSGNFVELWASMNMGQTWMRYEKDFFFYYYVLTHISPSFGPAHDQNTEIAVYGFNFFQGQGRRTLFPGFEYDYTCVFRLPWLQEPVEVKSLTSTWTLTTSPRNGSRFACQVPPGLVGKDSYTGPVEVGVSLNPCIHDPDEKEIGCLDSLPYTTDPIVFYYVQNTVNVLSVRLGPMTGGTMVTISGDGFDRRDLSDIRPYLHPAILCRWGSVISKGVYNLTENSVNCLSPACVTSATVSCASLTLMQCPECAVPVHLEVALNGQDFTESRVTFSYFKDPQVQSIYPTLGSVLGGTTITIESSGFHDPCQGCLDRKDCNSCSSLVVCKFQAFFRVEYTAGQCVKSLRGDACTPNRILCSTPPGKVLRGNIVSLDVFYVAVSVSVNKQQFFPINLVDNEPYNVYHPPCLGSDITECAFLFKFYEIPVLTSVFPQAISGDGGGRITVTGSNFLNENGLRCRYGSVLGPPACQFSPDED